VRAGFRNLLCAATSVATSLAMRARTSLTVIRS
jgi:hypothetical protein